MRKFVVLSLATATVLSAGVAGALAASTAPAGAVQAGGESAVRFEGGAEGRADRQGGCRVHDHRAQGPGTSRSAASASRLLPISTAAALAPLAR